MKKIFVIIFLLHSSIIYTSFAISVSSEFQIIRVSRAYEIILSEIIDRNDIMEYSKDSVSIIVGKYELNILDEKNVPYKVVAYDAERFYTEQMKTNITDATQSIDNFSFGSMGYFYKLNEIYSEFEKLIGKYKEYFINYEIIGKSYEGRDIVCYTFGAPLEQNKPQILLTALHHAREPASIVAIIYFLQKFFESAQKGDQNASYLLKERTIFVIPVVNPDGYYFNEMRHPNGGGLWRKNRRKINDTTYGVDLNRNYGPYEFWNSTNGGSLSAPNSNLYRGTEPFSEPETRAIRDFCNSKNIRLAFNYHTYGEVFIVPYSSLSNETKDSVFYRYLSTELSKYNKYAFGLDFKTIGYPACGTADDWMHYDNSKKDVIFAFTPEVGNIIDGFWLTSYDTTTKKQRIIELAKEQFYSIFTLLWSAGTNIVPIDFKYLHNQMVLSLTLRNIGLVDLNSRCNISISANSTEIEFLNNPTTIDFLESNSQVLLEFPISIKNSFKNGTGVDFFVSLQYEGFQRIDTFNIKLYQPDIISLYKSGDNLEFWETEYWGNEFSPQEGFYVLTDSPNMRYKDSLENFITLKKPISLRDINSAEIELTLKWEIDYYYDIATIEVSTDNGSNWNYLETSRMKYGLNLKESMHKSHIPAFTGHFPLWIRQKASLDKFLGNEILIRLGVISGPSVRFDGIFIKDIKLMLYPELMNISNEDYIQPGIQIYPNPGRVGENIYFDIYRNNFHLSNITLFNYLGQRIYEFDVSNMGRINIDTSNFEPGFYFVIINNGMNYFFTKLLIIK